MSAHEKRIDWGRVRAELLKKERIPRSGEVLEAAEACLKQAKRLARPRVVSVPKKLASPLPEGLRLRPSLVLRGRRLAASLRGATSVRIFVATIGDALENAASRYMEDGEALHGYLMDRIASLAVESLAENHERYLRDFYAPRGESVSARLSPGYCDWPVEEQRKLARVIPFSRAGVRLTESCMMVPKKSISAIVGIGPKGLFSPKRRAQCGVCDMVECSYRVSK